jgi:hypothetical protein
MAHALAGRADVGDTIARELLRQSLRVWDRWSGAGPPSRWFEHHTILMARAMQTGAADDARSDTLAGAAATHTPQHLALVRALRRLPFQQREAFILHYGGGFDLRRLAQSMDCSMDAASMHLSGANEAMRALADEQFDAFSLRIGSAYRAINPSDDLYLPVIRRHVRTYRWMRVVQLALVAILWLALMYVFAAIASIAWRWSPWGPL